MARIKMEHVKRNWITLISTQLLANQWSHTH